MFPLDGAIDVRIDAHARIAGIPTIVVRAFLRGVRDGEWNADYAAGRLPVCRHDALRLIGELVKLGYLEQASPGADPSFKCTSAGSRLAQASAARPLRRKTAERKLAELLARVLQINGENYYLYRVKRVLVFGSYLTRAERLNDVDVAIELTQRCKDPEKHFRLCDSRVEKCIQDGRRFSSIAQEVTWPQTEVWLALKARSRAISLHPTNDAVLQRVETKIVFEETVAEQQMAYRDQDGESGARTTNRWPTRTHSAQ